MAQPQLLTPEEAASYLQVSERTLRTWRAEGKSPPYSRIGHRTIRYSLSALEAWISSIGTDKEANTAV